VKDPMYVLAARLAAYIAHRAYREGVPCELPPEFYQYLLNRGVARFFGVETSGEMITSDDQEPEPGFLAAFINNEERMVPTGLRRIGKQLAPRQFRGAGRSVALR
jgi:hypothetical protein